MRRALAVALLAGLVARPAAASGTATMSMVLVCVPSTTGAAVAPCNFGGSTLLMPSLVSGYVLPQGDYDALTVISSPIDATIAAQCFAGGVIAVIGCWMVSFFCGTILAVVRG